MLKLNVKKKLQVEKVIASSSFQGGSLLQIILAEHRGFCYGVDRAVNMAREWIGKKAIVATLGPIIHNPQFVERLAEQGVGVVEKLSDMSSGTVIIRSHGVGPEVYEQAKAMGLNVVDATCPHVSKAQHAAEELWKAGYQVVVVGNRDHPEVRSIAAWTGDTAVVVETISEAKAVGEVPRLGIVAQTTFPPERFDDIVQVLKTKSQNVNIQKTICIATEQRQQAAILLAAQADVMVVVGGKNSANTSKLAELCRMAGSTVYHIETSAELEEKWFRGVRTAGITAGASTPDWIIEEVYQRMQEFAAMLDDDVKTLEQGSLVEGKVVGVREDEVFVDIGYKAEGIIPLAELAYPQPEKAGDVVTEGDTIKVYVIDADTVEGTVKLSKVKADQILAWDELEQALADKRPVEGKVLEAIKGGLAVAVLGVRGFVPASQADIKFVEDLTVYVGQILEFLPLEVDRVKNRVVLSRRAILEEERREKEKAIFSSLTPGQVVKGKVRRLTDFGAFVDIGGIDGLIHISDLSWQRVKKPSEIVSVDDEVEVAVLKVDAGERRISLSLKAIQRDPWLDAVEVLKVGKVVQGKVTKLSKFGAFVEVAKGVEGLVHLSELDERRVTHVEEVLSVDQVVPVKVLNIDCENKRISLSIVQARQEAERAEFTPFLDKDTKGLGFTIGDKLGHLFKQK
ncbi:MAG: 4-hydroxy-3-methylbut-2-enyl diphosphate reductase [Firmicutes bacterium]|nr:4-hydroxy-3-methylbut-2-enyl diphosphate reductase [Bacillota bacterium]